MTAKQVWEAMRMHCHHMELRMKDNDSIVAGVCGMGDFLEPCQIDDCPLLRAGRGSK